MPKPVKRCPVCGRSPVVHRWGYCQLCSIDLRLMLDRMAEVIDDVPDQPSQTVRRAVRTREPRRHAG